MIPSANITNIRLKQFIEYKQPFVDHNKSKSKFYFDYLKHIAAENSPRMTFGAIPKTFAKIIISQIKNPPLPGSLSTGGFCISEDLLSIFRNMIRTYNALGQYHLWDRIKTDLENIFCHNQGDRHPDKFTPPIIYTDSIRQNTMMENKNHVDQIETIKLIQKKISRVTFDFYRFFALIIVDCFKLVSDGLQLLALLFKNAVKHLKYAANMISTVTQPLSCIAASYDAAIDFKTCLYLHKLLKSLNAPSTDLTDNTADMEEKIVSHIKSIKYKRLLNCTGNIFLATGSLIATITVIFTLTGVILPLAIIPVSYFITLTGALIFILLSTITLYKWYNNRKIKELCLSVIREKKEGSNNQEKTDIFKKIYKLGNNASDQLIIKKAFNELCRASRKYTINYFTHMIAKNYFHDLKQKQQSKYIEIMEKIIDKENTKISPLFTLIIDKLCTEIDSHILSTNNEAIINDLKNLKNKLYGYTENKESFNQTWLNFKQEWEHFIKKYNITQNINSEAANLHCKMTEITNNLIIQIKRQVSIFLCDAIKTNYTPDDLFSYFDFYLSEPKLNR